MADPLNPRPFFIPSRTRDQRVAFIGTYPPRQCGIATFTRDLASAVAMGAGRQRPAGRGQPAPADHDVAVEVVAIDYEARDFPAEVRLRLDPKRPGDYLLAADRLNRSDVQAVSLQHEFGIYGGPDGELVLNLIDELDVPLVTTLHTVLGRPSDRQREILGRIAQASDRVVVLADSAAALLEDVYGVEHHRIEVVPHGVPDLAFTDAELVKPLVGLAGRPVILSFGLLGPGKGYELAIRAMSRVIEESPDACYVILGATHPELLRREGEAYREGLQALAAELDLGDHIRFVNEFVNVGTLGRWLQASDVFVTPYPGAEQAVSGTLAYALGTGKAIVSTPYAYARELLADGRGELVPFGDTAALGAAISAYLTDDLKRTQARRRAYAFGRNMTWARVGSAYRRIFAEVAAHTLRPWERDAARPAGIPLTPQATAPGRSA